MNTFKSFTMVRQPIDELWLVMRDRLGEIGSGLKDIRSIEVLERVELPEGRLRFLNRWTSLQQIPAMLRGPMGGDSISWLDRAEWDDAARTCAWTIEPSVLPGYIDCGGTTRFEPAMAGRGTRVTFEGHFKLRPGFLSGLPAALEPAVQSLVESIVSTVVPRNLIRVVTAAAQSIAAQKSERSSRA